MAVACRACSPPVDSEAPKPRLLRLAVEHADLWNDWLVFGRSHSDAVPPLREAVDAACVQAGRDPATLGRTVSIMVAAPGHEPAPTGPGVEPVVGDAAAAELPLVEGEGPLRPGRLKRRAETRA